MNEYLKQLGIINNESIKANLSFDELFDEELSPKNEGLEKGYLTNLGAITVDTGRFTGRSPKDKYFVKDEVTKDTMWWSGTGSDNQPIEQKTWEHLKKISINELSGKALYIMDGFCGTNPESRLSIRLITEVAWMAHFFKNMFIRPTEEELKNFTPNWTILSACKTTCADYKDWGLRSEVFAAFNIKEKMTCIGGTWYGGEIKKGIFSIMNYFLPLEGVAALHCSANIGEANDTALFFGLSGTGKTTLSADPKRKLIGDDEHGWDQNGVFNFEGGCYAKTISLSKEKEPDIYKAIHRNALLENVVVNQDGIIDFDDAAKTENTRVSYPIFHINNIVKPISKANHAKTVIFLTCDAYGVLPPVSRLTKEQAMYQYISGYTAKVAGTELGIVEPTTTFSACFGAPFLTLHPMKYAELLGQRMAENKAKAYLVNTGWSGGPYGIGKRISLKDTRAIIDAILDGSFENSEFVTFPIFNLGIPTKLPNVNNAILNPRSTWDDKEAYDKAAIKLATQFIDNFLRFTDFKAAKELVQSGPQLSEADLKKKLEILAV